MCPLLSRPPLLFFCSTSRDSGRERVISSNLGTVLNRVAGVSGLYLRSGMVLYLLEDLDRLALFQGDESLLPIGSVSRVPALALRLAVHADGAHRLHLHGEDRLDGALDLDLVRVASDLEEVPVLLLAEPGALLGDHGASHDGARFLAHAFTRSARLLRPPSVRRRQSQFMSAYVCRVRLSAVRTRARFRVDLRAFSSILSKTQRTFFSLRPIFSISSAIVFVLGSSSEGTSTMTTPPSCARAVSAPHRARIRAFAFRCVV